MSNTLNVSVAIGRNVGAVPLTDSPWQQYQRGVRGILYQFGVAIDCEVEGEAAYNGIVEPTYIVYGTIEGTEQDIVDTLAFISQHLAALAAAYDQEAVALTIGHTNIVPATNAKVSV